MRSRLLSAVFLFGILAGEARAHVGSPDTFFAGAAGPYPVRVTVRPPGVVPGRAEVFVRVEGAGVRSVTVRPMRADTGPRGAPRPDAMTPVAGQPGLYAGSLWLMTEGGYAIEAAVSGDRGAGKVTVPVSSMATRSLPMGTGLVVLVAGFALLLVAGGLAIVFAAASQATLPPGEIPGPARRRRAGFVTAAAGVVLLALLWGERSWSATVARRAGQRIFRPLAVSAAAETGPAGRVLRLTITDPRWGQEGARYFIPDHGKLVHLFAMREPMLDAFVHLHPAPVPASPRAFEAALPPVPEGDYSVYADVTDETGIAQTLVCRVHLPPLPPARAHTTTPTDPDDSWRVSAPLPPVAEPPSSADLGGGWTMAWTAPDSRQPVLAGRDVELTFAVRDGAGRPAALEPYMGMLAHAAVLRADGTVFVHLHPMGTVSMATLDAAGPTANASASPMMGMDMDHGTEAFAEPGPSSVSLPYAFPKPGPYRLWVQVKTAGLVRTGVFDLLVR